MARYLIWPDLYKEHGHWLPCVNLANSLMADDSTNVVEFMGIPDCESIVAPYGATFHPILNETYPAGHSIENKLEPLDQRWKPAHLMPLCRGEQGIAARFASGAAPDVLICGYFSTLEALLLHHRYDVRIVIMTTYLRHPMDDPAMFAKTKLVYMPRAYVRAMFAAVGKPDMTIEQFIKPVEGYFPELIPCPKELDFDDDDWIHGKNVVYVEPMIERHALVTPAPTIPGSIDLEDYEELYPSGVIFATSGSQIQDYEAKAREFFRNLILMMQTEGMGSYLLLASVGTKLKKELEATFINTLPANVLLREWVSQLDVLSNDHIKAVFMHGGLATIKEAIWEEKPIIVVPHGKDQLDNALRLHRRNLAMVAQPGDLAPTNLRKLLMAAMSNTWMRSSAAQMRSVFSTYESPAPPSRKLSLQELDKVLDNDPTEST